MVIFPATQDLLFLKQFISIFTHNNTQFFHCLSIDMNMQLTFKDIQFLSDLLSLYSTRTQNTWRRGLALGNAPDASILRYPTQNIPTCWYILR